MINFVKTMKNLRKRVIVKVVVNSEKDFLKHISKPTFISTKIFDKNYSAIHEIKLVLTLSKPIYVGFTVFELSEWLFHSFHYDFILKNVDVKLLFTDTDCFTYEIKSEDVYKEFLKHGRLFDLSNYPKDSKFFGSSNNKVTGKMKGLSEGKINCEFVGLKSKMHSMKNIDDKESNTTKGVNIANEFNEFKDTLFNKKVVIQNKKHKIGKYKVNKISLLCFDDRRCVLDDGICTLCFIFFFFPFLIVSSLTFVVQPMLFQPKLSSHCCFPKLYSIVIKFSKLF